jgi:membrane glycosyltransferase
MAIPMGVMDYLELPLWLVVLAGAVIASPFLIKWAIQDLKESDHAKK